MLRGTLSKVVVDLVEVEVVAPASFRQIRLATSASRILEHLMIGHRPESKATSAIGIQVMYRPMFHPLICTYGLIVGAQV